MSNRLAVIHETTDPSDWRHVGTKSNPADYASRGLDAENFLRNSTWICGPPFLWMSGDNWPAIPDVIPVLSSDDPELKQKSKVCASQADMGNSCMQQVLHRYSSWQRLCKAVAWLTRFSD